jgi:hypothetical protein
MLSVPSPPSREEIEAQFVALLNGSQSRDQVDRWAAQWVTDPDAGGVDDEDVWWALTLLCGVDLRHGEHATYLHDDEQVRDWLEAFRTRCSMMG